MSLLYKLWEFLPGILIGAWTGYITNEIALRMIFKEYRIGIFGLGGVIPKTRAEFTQGIIDLVNDELIRPEALGERIQKSEFTDAAARILMDTASRVLSYIENNATVSSLLADIKNGNPDENITEWAADVSLTTLAADCGALWQKLIYTVVNSKDIQNAISRFASKLPRTPEFYAACGDFARNFDNIRLKSMLGERYFTDIKEKLSYAFSDIAVTVGVELYRDAEEFSRAAADLLIDSRTLDRLSRAVENKNLAELLDFTDFNGWREFVGKRPSGAGAGIPSGDISKFIDALFGCSRFNDLQLGHFIRSDTPELDTALTGVYALLTGYTRDLLEKHCDELTAMLESSVEHSLSVLETNRPGLAAYARRALYSGVADSRKLYERLAAFAVSWCAGLSDKHTAGDFIAKIFEKDIRLILGLDFAVRLKRGDIFDLKHIYAAARDAVAGGLARLPEMLGRISISDTLKGLGGEGRAKTAASLSGIFNAAIRRALTSNGPARIKAKETFAAYINELGETEVSEFIKLGEKNDASGKGRMYNVILPKLILGLGKNIGAQPGLSLINYLPDAALAFIRKAIQGAFTNIKTSGIIYAVKTSITALSRREQASGLFSSIFNSLSDRFESVVRGKINEAIKRKLDGYKDDELSSLARTFFGQLKHIALLGAVMGALIGVLTTVSNRFVENLAVGGGSRTAAVISVAANIALYALIGLITNIAALELLFRPRRELRLPGFSLQSVISRNKDRFAGAVGKFLATLTADSEKSGGVSGMSAERFSEVFETQINRAVPILVKEYGTSSAARKAASGLTPKLRSALIGNSDYIASYVADNLPRLIKAMGGSSAEQVQPQAPVDILKTGGDGPESGSAGAGPENRSDMTSLKTGSAGVSFENGSAEASLENGSAGAYEWLFDALIALLNSDINAYDIFSAANAGFIEKEIRELLYDIDSIELRGLSRHMAGSLYGNFLDRNAQKPVLPPRNELKTILQRALTSETILGFLGNVLFKPPGPERKGAMPEDALVRFAVEECQKQSPRLSESLRLSCRKLLIDNSELIAKTFASVVSGRSGFLASFVMRVTDGEAFINIAAQNFFAVQIPAFIDRRAGEIDEILERLLLHMLKLLSDERFNDRFFRVDTRKMSESIYDIIKDEQVAGAAADVLADILSDLFGDATVKETAAVFGADTARGLLMRLEALIRPFCETLTEGARIEAEDLARVSASFCEKIIRVAGPRITAADIFGGVRRSDLSLIAESLIKTFFRAGRMKAFLRDSLPDGDGEEGETLRVVVAALINGMLAGEDGQDMENIITALITRASDRFGEIWKDDFSAGVSRLFADAGSDALIAGMADIVGAVDLRSLAEEQINKMDTRSIERVFRSFAGRYIRRLKLYGLWGGVFGAHPVLPAATAVAAALGYLTRRVRGRQKS